jgi:hypothetical protein
LCVEIVEHLQRITPDHSAEAQEFRRLSLGRCLE